MNKYLLGLIIVLAIACSSGSKMHLRSDEFWIPDSSSWLNGNFNTFYFINDTSFILLSSTQSLIRDSIYFQIEPGFILRQGSIIKQNPNEIEIAFRVLYRFITIPGDSTPSTVIKANLPLNGQDQKSTYFEFEGIKYSKTLRYTNNSVKAIRSIASKMVPDLKKEFGLD
jgi:hypothetical protein